MKFRVAPLMVVITAFTLMCPLGVLAAEPLDMKRITDADKVYFGRRLTPEQVEKLQQIIANGFTTGKVPCDKVAAINKTLQFLNTVTPVFREASASNEISGYARRYSASLAREFTETAAVFVALLPRYKQACSAGQQTAHETKVALPPGTADGNHAEIKSP